MSESKVFEYHHLYIPKDEFDWAYYLDQNQDIKKAGINNLDNAYKHWITYGCHENKWVKSLKTGSVLQIKLKRNEKMVKLIHDASLTSFKMDHPYQSQAFVPSYVGLMNQSITLRPMNQSITLRPMNLEFKIAIMIHIFNINMFPFFIAYLNDLSQLYSDNNFDIYINIVGENSPYFGDLEQAIKNHMKTIINPNVYYFVNENRGGDIGGFLLLSKYIIDLNIDYKYVIFVHSKTSLQWRKELCRTVFNIRFETLPKTPDVGLIGAKKWLHRFDPTTQQEEYRRFKYHLVDLCNIYELNCGQSWQFIAGTMFLAHIDIIKYIVSHNISEVYSKLNKPDSIDINWLKIVTDELKKDPKGAGNDLQYRLKYGKPLHPDYMIEHTFERIIGLICKNLQLKIVGQ